MLDLVRPNRDTIAMPHVLMGALRAGLLQPGSAAIPLRADTPPVYNDHRVFRGSFVPDGTGLTVSALTREDAENGIDYLITRTGFVFGEGGLMGDLMRISEAFKQANREMQLFAHGAVSLHTAPSEMLVALNVGGAINPAEMLKGAVRFVKGGLGVPAYVYRLWRMPRDSAVLCRDVTGHMCRAVKEGTAPTRRVDADDKRFHDMFDIMLEEQVKPKVVLATAA